MSSLYYSETAKNEDYIPVGNWLLVLALIILSASPVFSEFNRGLAIMICSAFIIWKDGRFKKRDVLLLLLALLPLMPMTMVDLFESFTGGFATLSFLFIPASLLLGWLAARSFQVGNFAYIFERIVFFLSFISLVLYGIVFAFPWIVNFFPEYTYGDFTSRSIFFLNVLIGEDIIYRNSGFASEPGLFQFFLNAALYIALVQRGKFSVSHLLYVAAVLSTASTTGLIIMSLILIFFTKGLYKILVLAVCAIFFSYLLETFLYHWNNKIINDYAFMGRLGPALRAWDVFLANPLGIGAVQYTENYRDLGIGSWDSYSQVALRYGILGFFSLGWFLLQTARKGFGLFFVFALSFMTNAMWPFAICSCFYFVNRASFWRTRNRIH